MGRQEVNTEIEPIIGEPNNYFRSCDKKLSGPGSYRYHLRIIHQIETPKKMRPIYPRPYCGYCDINYSSAAYHHKRMLRFHGELVLPLDQK